MEPKESNECLEESVGRCDHSKGMELSKLLQAVSQFYFSFTHKLLKQTSSIHPKSFFNSES